MDPIDQYHSRYCYVGNNPIYFVDKNGLHGIAFLVELDAGMFSGSYIVAVDFGICSNKFQVGVFETKNQMLKIENGEGGMLPLGFNVGVSVNLLLTIGSNGIKDWTGKVYEIEGSIGEYNVSIASDLNKIFQISGGVGLGIGGGIQEVYTKLLWGVDIGKMLKVLMLESFRKIAYPPGTFPYFDRNFIIEPSLPEGTVTVGEGSVVGQWFDENTGIWKDW
jgi:hypothetical protein